MSNDSPATDAVTSPVDADRLIDLLWHHGADGPTEVFALLDAARDPRLHDLVRRSRLDHRCLFLGQVHPRLARAAPYLVHLSCGATFTRRLLEEGWGHSWGVFVRSPVILQDLRRHFRRFLQVRDEEGRKLFFRFYDPRVLRVYLPTCNRSELEYVFGPVDDYLIEDADGHRLLHFTFDRWTLTQVPVDLPTEPRAQPG